jgi:hypothetical protein
MTQAGLFARGVVLHTEHFTAPEHRELRFHVVIALNQATSPVKRRSTNARSGKVSASFRQFWQVV